MDLTYLSTEDLTLAHVNQLRLAIENERRAHSYCRKNLDDAISTLHIRDDELTRERKRLEIFSSAVFQYGFPSEIVNIVGSWIPSRIGQFVDILCCVKIGESWGVVRSGPRDLEIFQNQAFDLAASSVAVGQVASLLNFMNARDANALLLYNKVSPALEADFLIFSVTPRSIWVIQDLGIHPSHNLGLEASSFLLEDSALLETASQIVMASLLQYLEKSSLECESIRGKFAVELSSILYSNISYERDITVDREIFASIPRMIERLSNCMACEIYIMQFDKNQSVSVLSSALKITNLSHVSLSIATASVEKDKMIVSRQPGDIDAHDVLDRGSDPDVKSMIAIPLWTQHTPRRIDDNVWAGAGLVMRYGASVDDQHVRISKAIAGVLTPLLQGWLNRSNMIATNLTLPFHCSQFEPADDKDAVLVNINSPIPSSAEQVHATVSLVGREDDIIHGFREFIHGGFSGFAGVPYQMPLLARELACDWVIAVIRDSSAQQQQQQQQQHNWEVAHPDGEEKGAQASSERAKVSLTLVNNVGEKRDFSIQEMRGQARNLLEAILGLNSPAVADSTPGEYAASGGLVSLVSMDNEVELNSSGLFSLLHLESSDQARTFSSLPSFVHSLLGLRLQEPGGTASAAAGAGGAAAVGAHMVALLAGRSWRPFDLRSVFLTLQRFNRKFSFASECRQLQRALSLTDALGRQVAQLDHDRRHAANIFELERKLSTIVFKTPSRHFTEPLTDRSPKHAVVQLENGQTVRRHFAYLLRQFISSAFSWSLSQRGSDGNGDGDGDGNLSLPKTRIISSILLRENVGWEGSSRYWELDIDGNWCQLHSAVSPGHRRAASSLSPLHWESPGGQTVRTSRHSERFVDPQIDGRDGESAPRLYGDLSSTASRHYRMYERREAAKTAVGGGMGAAATLFDLDSFSEADDDLSTADLYECSYDVITDDVDFGLQAGPHSTTTAAAIASADGVADIKTVLLHSERLQEFDGVEAGGEEGSGSGSGPVTGGSLVLFMKVGLSKPKERHSDIVNSSAALSPSLVVPSAFTLSALTNAVTAFVARHSRDIFGSAVDADGEADLDIQAHSTVSAEPKTQQSCHLSAKDAAMQSAALSAGVRALEETIAVGNAVDSFPSNSNFLLKLAALSAQFDLLPVRVVESSRSRSQSRSQSRSRSRSRSNSGSRHAELQYRPRGRNNSRREYQVLDVRSQELRELPHRISDLVLARCLDTATALDGDQDNGTASVGKKREGTVHWLPGAGGALYNYLADSNSMAALESSQNSSAFLYILKPAGEGHIDGYILFLALTRCDVLVTPSHVWRLNGLLNQACLPLVVSIASRSLYESMHFVRRMISSSQRWATTHLDRLSSTATSTQPVIGFDEGKSVDVDEEKESQEEKRRQFVEECEDSTAAAKRLVESFVPTIDHPLNVARGVHERLMEEWLDSGRSVLEGLVGCTRVRSAGYLTATLRENQDGFVMKKCCGDEYLPGQYTGTAEINFGASLTSSNKEISEKFPLLGDSVAESDTSPISDFQLIWREFEVDRDRENDSKHDDNDDNIGNGDDDDDDDDDGDDVNEEEGRGGGHSRRMRVISVVITAPLVVMCHRHDWSLATEAQSSLQQLASPPLPERVAIAAVVYWLSACSPTAWRRASSPSRSPTGRSRSDSPSKSRGRNLSPEPVRARGRGKGREDYSPEAAKRERRLHFSGFHDHNDETFSAPSTGKVKSMTFAKSTTLHIGSHIKSALISVGRVAGGLLTTMISSSRGAMNEAICMKYRLTSEVEAGLQLNSTLVNIVHIVSRSDGTGSQRQPTQQSAPYDAPVRESKHTGDDSRVAISRGSIRGLSMIESAQRIHSQDALAIVASAVEHWADFSEQHEETKGLNRDLHDLLTSQQKQLTAFSGFVSAFETIVAVGSPGQSAPFIGATGTVDTSIPGGRSSKSTSANPLENQLMKLSISASMNSLVLQRCMALLGDMGLQEELTGIMRRVALALIAPPTRFDPREPLQSYSQCQRFLRPLKSTASYSSSRDGGISNRELLSHGDKHSTAQEAIDIDIDGDGNSSLENFTVVWCMSRDPSVDDTDAAALRRFEGMSNVQKSQELMGLSPAPFSLPVKGIRSRDMLQRVISSGKPVVIEGDYESEDSEAEEEEEHEEEEEEEDSFWQSRVHRRSAAIGDDAGGDGELAFAADEDAGDDHRRIRMDIRSQMRQAVGSPKLRPSKRKPRSRRYKIDGWRQTINLIPITVRTGKGDGGGGGGNGVANTLRSFDSNSEGIARAAGASSPEGKEVVVAVVQYAASESTEVGKLLVAEVRRRFQVLLTALGEHLLSTRAICATARNKQSLERYQAALHPQAATEKLSYTDADRPLNLGPCHVTTLGRLLSCSSSLDEQTCSIARAAVSSPSTHSADATLELSNQELSLHCAEIAAGFLRISTAVVLVDEQLSNTRIVFDGLTGYTYRGHACTWEDGYVRRLSVAEVELSHQLLSDTAAATAAGPQVLPSLLMRPTRNARWSSSMRRTGRSGDTRSNGSDADSDPYVLVHRLCGLVDPLSSSSSSPLSPLSPPPATTAAAATAVVGYLIVESDRRIGETELASILAAVHIVSSVVRAKLARECIVSLAHKYEDLSQRMRDTSDHKALAEMSLSMHAESVNDLTELRPFSTVFSSQLPSLVSATLRSMVGSQSASLVKVDTAKVVAAGERLRSSHHRGEEYSAVGIACSTDAEDLAALCLATNAMVLRTNAALSDHGSAHSGHNLPEGDEVAWAFVPVAYFGQGVISRSSVRPGVSSGPLSSTAESGIAVAAADSDPEGSDSPVCLALRFSFSSVQQWVQFTGDAGRHRSARIGRNVALLAAQSLRQWVFYHRHVQALAHRSSALEGISVLCSQLTSCLDTVSASMMRGSIHSPDTLAAALAFLLQGAGTSTSVNEFQGSVQYGRLHWLIDGNAAEGLQPQTQQPSWQTVDLLVNKETKDSGTAASQFLSAAAKAFGTRDAFSQERQGAVSLTSSSASAPTSEVGANISLEVFLKMQYWRQRQSAALVQSINDVMGQRGSLLFGTSTILSAPDVRSDPNLSAQSQEQQYVDVVWLSVGGGTVKALLEIKLGRHFCFPLKPAAAGYISHSFSLDNGKRITLHRPHEPLRPERLLQGAMSLPSPPLPDVLSAFETLRCSAAQVVSHLSQQLNHEVAVLSELFTAALMRHEVAILTRCMAELSAEGGKVKNVCITVQQLIDSLPGVHSSSLTCMDIAEETVLYKAHSQNIEGDALLSTAFSEETRGPLDSDGGRAMLSDFDTSQLNKAHSSATTAAAVSTTASASPTTYHASATPSNGNSMSMLELQDRSALSKSNLVSHPRSAAAATKTPARQGVEIAFECFEIQGRLVIYHKTAEEISENARVDLDGHIRVEDPSNLRFSVAFAAELAAGASTHVSVGASAGSIGRSAHGLEGAAPAAYSAAHSLTPATMTMTMTPYQRRMCPAVLARLVSAPAFEAAERSLVQTITRSLARRTYEIHRGVKNKRIMSKRQEEIAVQRSRLMERDDRLINLESSKAVLLTELERANTDAERLRLLLIEEQEESRRANSKHRALEKQTTATLGDLRAAATRQETVLKKALSDAKEERRIASDKIDTMSRELARALEREKAAEKSRRDTGKEMESVERQNKKLRNDLQLAHQDLSKALSREAEKMSDGDAKLRALLTKLQNAEEEVTASRSSITFLRRQIEDSKKAIKISKEKTVRIENDLRATEIESEGHLKVLEVQLDSSKQRTDQAETEIATLRKALAKEQLKATQLTAQLHSMEIDRNALAQKWATLNRSLSDM